MTKSEWARKMAQEFKDLRAQEAEKASARLAEQSRRKQGASRLWSEVKEAFKERAEDFNAALGEEVLTWECSDPNAFRLGRKDISGCVKGTFQEAADEVKIEVLDRAVPFKVTFNYHSRTCHLVDAGGIPPDPEDSARVLIGVRRQLDLPGDDN